jgi:hypothetical protein
MFVNMVLSFDVNDFNDTKHWFKDPPPSMSVSEINQWLETRPTDKRFQIPVGWSANESGSPGATGELT